MARKSLEKQIAELKFDAKICAANQRRLITQVEPSIKAMSNDQLRSLAYVSEGFEMLGLSIDEGLRLAMRNRLPQALQDHHAKVFEKPMPNDNRVADDFDQRPPPPSLDQRYPRWRADDWRCACGEQKTLWHKTQFPFKDRNQIYCASCRTLSGWGGDRDFKVAEGKGDAKRIQITHPLDCEAFTPPLMIPSPNTQSQNLIRAKQSQGRPSGRNTIRTKRSQGPSSAQTPIRAKRSQG